MKKVGEVSYVKKVFRMMVVAMGYQGEYRYHYHTNYSGVQHSFSADTQVHINQIFQLSAIDTLHDGKPHNIDKIIHLQIYFDEVNISSITFDISRQKIVKQDSKSLFRKRFNKGKGYIDYKIVGVQTHVISKQQLRQQEGRRNEINMRKHLDFKTLQKQNRVLQHCIEEKDAMIESLTDKINSLVTQNSALNKKVNEDIRIMRSAMNINVNILPSKKEMSKSYESKEIGHLQKEKKERRKEDSKEDKDRISYLQVQNKRLEENLSILITQFRMGGTADSIRMKDLQKRMAEVDTLYLLKKNIQSYENNIDLPQKIQTISEEPSQHEITMNLMQNFALERRSSKININPPKLSRSENDPLMQTFGTPNIEANQKGFGCLGENENTGKSQVQRPGENVMKRSSMLNLNRPQQIQQSPSKMISPRASLLVPGEKEQAMKKSQSEKMRVSGMHKSMLDSALMKDDKTLLVAKIQGKDQQIEYLNNQINKKEETIKKISCRQQLLTQKIEQLEEEKAKTLVSIALNSLSKAGADVNSQIAKRIKQLSVYNNDLMRDKQELNKQMQQLKRQNEVLNSKLYQFEATNRKSLMVMTQIKLQKQIYQNTVNEMASNNKAAEMRELAEKGLDYEKVKEQLIECQQELNQSKKKEEEKGRQLQEKKEEISKLNGLVSDLSKQKVNLGLIAAKADHLKRENSTWNNKYNDIQKLQTGIKSFVLKMEMEVNKRMKNTTNDDLYKNDMKKLFRDIFSKVNNFQKEYYQALIEAMKAIEQSNQKYYEDIIKFYEEAAITPDQKADVWARKMDLFKERDVKVEWIKERNDIYKKKADRKLMVPEDQLNSVIEEVKKLQERMKEMEIYKITLQKSVKEGGLAAPVIEIRSLEDRSLNSSLISMMEMMKSNPQMVKSMAKENPDFLKVSGVYKNSGITMKQSAFPAGEKIDEQYDDQDEMNNSRFAVGKQSISGMAMSQLQTKIAEMKNVRQKEKEKRITQLSQIFEEKDKQNDMMRSKILKQNEEAHERIALKEREMRRFREESQKIRTLERALFNQKTEKERIAMHAKARENELEKQHKISQNQYQNQTLTLTKEKERFQSDIQMLKEQLQEKEEQISKLQEQMTNISEELQQTIKQKYEQKLISDALTIKVVEYEENEYLIKRQMLQIRQRCAHNEEQMNNLFEERNRQFLEIERLKSQQIENLNNVVLDLEEKISQQISENFNNKAKIEDLTAENKQCLEKLQKSREEASLMIETLQNQLNRQTLLREQLQKQNQVYHMNILQLSENIENLQKEILRLQCILDKFQKEKVVMVALQHQLTQKEERLKEDYKSYDYIIRQKNEKIAQNQKNFSRLQQELGLISRQIQSTKDENSLLKEDNEKIKEKQFAKEREIIRLEREISCLQMKLEKCLIENKDLENAVQELEGCKTELEGKLEEANQGRYEGKSPRTPASPLTPSRRMPILHHEQTEQYGQNASIRYTIPAKTVSTHSIMRSNTTPLAVQQKNYIISPKNQLTQSISSIHINVIGEKQHSGPSGSSSNHSGQDSVDSSEKEKRVIKRPGELLEIRPMIRNKSLHLTSIDTQMRVSDENSKLGIIEEHNQELNDTFLKSPRHSRKLEDELEGYKMDEYEMQEFHPQQRAEQSAVDIDVMESMDANSYLQKKSVRFNLQMQKDDISRRALGQTNDAAFKGYQSYETLDLINRIMELQAQNQELKTIVDHSCSKIKSGDVSMLQIPEIRNTMNSNSSDMKNLSDRSSKERPQMKPQRMETTRSVNAMDFMMKQNEEQIHQLQIKCEEAERKVVELELILSENQEENRQLQHSVDERKRNIELLMEEIKTVTDTNCELSLQNQKIKKYCLELKNFQQIQLKNLTEKYEDLAAETMQKDQALFNLQLQFKKQKQISQNHRTVIQQQQTKIKQLKQQLKDSTKKIKKYQKQYVAYQEQAELQILRLKEENDRLSEQYKEKESQIQVIGLKYVELEDKMKMMGDEIQQQKGLNTQQEKQARKIVGHYEDVRSQLEVTEQQRRRVVDRTKSVDNQNIRLKEQIQNLSKQTALEIQKYNIKLTQQGQILAHVKSKLQEKEKAVIELKNQLALYNEETEVLKQANEDLNRQLTKTQRELKEIMGSYETEFSQMSKEREKGRSQNNQYVGTVKQKDLEIEFKKRQIRAQQTQIRGLKNDYADLNSKHEKYKLSVVVKLRDLQNELAIKNDRIQRLNNQISILTTKLSEEKLVAPDKRIHSYEAQIKALKDQIQEKDKEIYEKIKQMQSLPSVDEVKQLEFKIGLLRNQVKDFQNEKSAEMGKKYFKEEEVMNIYQKYGKEMAKDRQLLAYEREKSTKVISELKQVVEAYKSLEFEHSSLRNEVDILRKTNKSQQLVNKHQQRLVDELQRQNQELSRSPSCDLLSKRSFSRMMTDVTL